MTAGQSFPQPQPLPPASSPEPSSTEIFLKVCRAVVWVIYAIVLVNTVVLSLAFLLRLLGANPDAGFTEWVYRSADRSMGPFRGIFPEHPIGDASVLDLSLLFAAIVYVVVALLIDGLLRWLGQRVRAEQRSTAARDREAQWRAEQQRAIDEQQRAAAAEPWAQAPAPGWGDEPGGRGPGG